MTADALLGRPLEDAARVVVLDDVELFRRRLVVSLEQHDDLEVVGDAGDVAEAGRLCRSHRADVAVVALTLTDVAGHEAVAALAAASPRTLLVALVAPDDDPEAPEARRAGAVAVVDRDRAEDELAPTVQRVAGGT